MPTAETCTISLSLFIMHAISVYLQTLRRLKINQLACHSGPISMLMLHPKLLLYIYIHISLFSVLLYRCSMYVQISNLYTTSVTEFGSAVSVVHGLIRFINRSTNINIYIFIQTYTRKHEPFGSCSMSHVMLDRKLITMQECLHVIIKRCTSYFRKN